MYIYRKQRNRFVAVSSKNASTKVGPDKAKHKLKKEENLLELCGNSGALGIEPAVHVCGHVPANGVVVDVYIAHASQHFGHVLLHVFSFAIAPGGKQKGCNRG